MCAEKHRNQKEKMGVARHFFGENEALIDKWCLNFIGVIVLGCAGQRPEVFLQMQAPTIGQLGTMEIDAVENEYFEIRVVAEKVPRSISMPFPIVPSKLFSIVKFHVSFVRPVILWKAKVSER